MNTVVRSYNIFVDSNDIDQKGDDIVVHGSQTEIKCHSDESIRLTLQNFSMSKTFYNVNETNNLFIFGWLHTKTEARLDPTDVESGNNYVSTSDHSGQDVGSLHALSEMFGTKLKDLITTKIGATISAEYYPDFAQGIDDGLKKLEIVYSFDSNVNLPDNILIQTPKTNKSYELLGGKAVDPNTNDQSFEIKYTTELSPNAWVNYSYGTEVSDVRKLLIKSKYVATRITQPFLYLNTDLVSHNYETNTKNSSIQISHSQKFAKLPVLTEFVHFDSSTGNEYFIDIPNKAIPMMRFYLTDSQYNKVTLDSSHSVTGNFKFNMVLRCDIIHHPYKNIMIGEQPSELIGTKAGVLKKLDFGNSPYPTIKP